MQRTAVMQLEPDCSLLPEQLRGCRLVLACVSVGNVGQLAVDVVLATLSRQHQLTLVSQVPCYPVSSLQLCEPTLLLFRFTTRRLSRCAGRTPWPRRAAASAAPCSSTTAPPPSWPCCSSGPILY